MRLRSAYTLILFSKLPQGFNIPFRLELEDGTFEISEVDEEGEHATVIIERSVNPENLSIRTGLQPFDGGEPDRGISVSEKSTLSEFLSRVVNILSFLTDIPLRYSHKLGQDRLVAETEADHIILQKLGTEDVFQETSVSISVRTFSMGKVSEQDLQFLMARDVGLALYAQARLVQQPVSVFREYWRILESAFGTKDSDLIDLLSEYRPAQQMDFTNNELRSLLVLRGRASHAESRSGIKEYQFVTEEVSRLLPRLKCLVEQVILTKKTWGIQTLETEQLARLDAFINSEGSPVLIRYLSSEDW